MASSCDALHQLTEHGNDHSTLHEFQDLEVKNDVFYLEGKLFTGVVYDHLDSDAHKAEYKFLNGKKHGKQTQYFENGQMKSQEKYVNGKLHGVQKEWWLNGNMKETKDYELNIQEGYAKQWYSNGRLKRKELFETGKSISLEQWDRAGNIIAEDSIQGE